MDDHGDEQSDAEEEVFTTSVLVMRIASIDQESIAWSDLEIHNFVGRTARRAIAISPLSMKTMTKLFTDSIVEIILPLFS